MEDNYKFKKQQHNKVRCKWYEEFRECIVCGNKFKIKRTHTRTKKCAECRKINRLTQEQLLHAAQRAKDYRQKKKGFKYKVNKRYFETYNKAMQHKLSQSKLKYEEIIKFLTEQYPKEETSQIKLCAEQLHKGFCDNLEIKVI